RFSRDWSSDVCSSDLLEQISKYLDTQTFSTWHIGCNRCSKTYCPSRFGNRRTPALVPASKEHSNRRDNARRIRAPLRHSSATARSEERRVGQSADTGG